MNYVQLVLFQTNAKRLINNENITSNKNDINDFNIDDLLSNKEYNNSNNNKKHKKIIANNSSKISKTKSSVNTERTNNIDTSQKNANIDSTNKNQQILKKLNAKFEQLESGVVVSAMGRTMKKNNFINDKKRGKSGEKMKIHYEFNKIKNPKNSKTFSGVLQV